MELLSSCILSPCLYLLFILQDDFVKDKHRARKEVYVFSGCCSREDTTDVKIRMSHQGGFASDFYRKERTNDGGGEWTDSGGSSVVGWDCFWLQVLVN